MSGNGCREEIVAAAKAMETSRKADFSPGEMIQYLRGRGTKYRDSTIRTHVVSRMCANAPDHHAVTYPDLERIAPGRYRLARHAGARAA